MTDDRDDERVRGARELLGWINNIRPTDMTQLFYMHCHNELVLALEDLLDSSTDVRNATGMTRILIAAALRLMTDR
ncbi:hypothetical protein [Georgenia sp. SUBG003]|uniref:hypothetical protein n=1 Tax=Georgenia sp. SUBG003 TaxID=1497974 RepID=UPI0004D95489|nr:hypothetical protein DA06_31580 [Georgenia sp. SUBG003]